MYTLSTISYPCYVSPILGPRVVYLPDAEIPGLYDTAGKYIAKPSFLKLQKISDYVLEGYIYNNQLKIFDCIPLKDWTSKKCQITYEDRLGDLRTILSGTLVDYSKYIEVDNYLVGSPKEIKFLYTQFLTSGFKGAMVMDMDGLYTWGDLGTPYQMQIVPQRR